MLKFNYKLAIIILSIAFLFGYFRIFTINNNSNAVAIIGEEKITVNQFINSYSFGSSLLKPKPRPKLFFLNAMINEMVLAKELSNNAKHKIQNDDFRIELLKQELLIENIFRIEVDNKINITKEELLRSILDSQKKIKASYIHSPVFERIVQIRDSLINGYDLNQLFDMRIINDDIKIEETDYMEHSQIYEPFKSIIHKLSPQTYSEIIESDIGYYIIRIEDIITNSLSDMEIKKLETTHKKIIWNKKGTQLAKDFVDSFMSAKKVIIKSKSFNNLVKNTFGFYKNLGSIPLNDKIYSELDLHDNWLSDTLIVHRHGIVRTKQFLDFMKLRPIKYDIKNIDSFSNDLEEKLAIIIRDYFLILEYGENYNFNQSEILNQISQWKKKYVVEDYLQKLHYSFVKNNLEKNQFNNFLERKLDSLRSKINISINHELLSNVDVIDNVKSHMPELQLYKLGLPYLKKAYPTPHFMFSYINNPN